MEKQRSRAGTFSRRDFLKAGGVGLAAGVLFGIAGAEAYDSVGAPPTPSSGPSGSAGANGNPSTDLPEDLYGNWSAVRDQFELRRDRIHMAGFLLASHPKPVGNAIETHRQGLDEDPVGYLHGNGGRLEGEVYAAAAQYLGASPGDIALTDSTTMGLGLLYGGLRLRESQEILTTVHDHYATANSLRLRAQRTGAIVRPPISLYQDLAVVSKDEVVASLVKAVRPQTRVVAITWVHSSTGLKLPLPEIANALAEINQDREEEDRALLCVDGVHGLGVEDLSVEDLGCDFFVAGCHKWLFGPRGTGLVWGKSDAWPAASPTIPTFDGRAFGEWTGARSYEDWWDSAAESRIPMAAAMTPGGYHSFEHRWALDRAFRFHQAIGKSLIAERIHGLNRQLKEGLAKMSNVRLHTPIDEELSAGIVCFEVNGLSPTEVVGRLGENGIIASASPYHTSYARLAPSLLTSPEDVDETLNEVQYLAG
ncbi:MAG: aminotransferase class V-fold PLP-dependent enzyme [Actinomycetota bacterium]|nr:aminotransferase class V-fold PLP-dependent enzyme [Actinomycetota bacterium]